MATFFGFGWLLKLKAQKDIRGTVFEDGTLSNASLGSKERTHWGKGVAGLFEGGGCMAIGNDAANQHSYPLAFAFTRKNLLFYNKGGETHSVWSLTSGPL